MVRAKSMIRMKLNFGDCNFYENLISKKMPNLRKEYLIHHIFLK